MSLFVELKRRNVIRVAIAYIVIGWLILQAGETLAPALHLPGWVNSMLAFFLLLGFPLALVFAWAFELTPEGVKLEKNVDRESSIAHATGRKLNFIIIALMAAALAYFAAGKTIFTDRAINVDPPASARSVTAARSIAVLPFVNMSSDEEQEYFSDGLSEELLNLLAKIPELRVTSRSSAFSYKGKDFKISQIGRELNVEHVLEGSVRKSGNTVRITAQLIDVDKDVHLWSETWDRQLDDIFEIQDEIARAVVDALRIRLLGEVPRVLTTTPEAYSLYLQSRYWLSQRSVANNQRAEALIRRALEIDPGYAPAWVRLAEILLEGATIGSRPATEIYPLMLDAVRRALEIDANSARAQSIMAMIAMRSDFDIDSARRHMEKSLELAPGDANVLINASRLNLSLGDFAESVRLSERAAVLDPVFPRVYASLGYAYFYLGRNEDALETLRKAVELSPDAVGIQYYIGCVLLASGNIAAALEAMQAETMDGFQFTGLALVHHALGNDELSDAALDNLIRVWGETGSYQIATVYAYKGDADKAFYWLDKAFEVRDTGLLLTMGDPFLDNIRDDPRFDALLRRMGIK